MHKSDVHIGQKKYKCDWPGCEWIGTNHAQELRFHKLRKHEGVKIRKNMNRKPKSKNPNAEKKHGCSWPGCGKRFLYKSVLLQHSRSHQTPGKIKMNFY